MNSLHRYAWVVWGIAAVFYFSDYTARVAPGVMHAFLQQDFGINEAKFGMLTASFYVPYILMQIPVGLIVDRRSIRRILTYMSLLTGVGCVVFGMAHGIVIASMGRMLIGFSAAFAFISALRLATAWFPPKMLGLLAGLTQALGMLGAAVGEAPVAFLVERVGWRISMLIIAALFIILAGMLFRYIQDSPAGSMHYHKSNNAYSIINSLKMVLQQRQSWFNALYAGFLFVPTAVIGESIGPAYLQFGQGLSAHEAAFAVGLIFIGWGIGGPLAGWLSDKLGRRKPIMIISACFGVLLSYFIIYTSLNTPVAYILLFSFGFTNAGVAISYAVSTELHDRAIIGTSIAFTNMASIFVGALLQPIVGWMIDYTAGARGYHVESLSLADFQFGLGLLPIACIISLALAFAIKETYCKPL